MIFVRPSQNIAGIAIIVLGLFLFALQDVAIKSFSDCYSVVQIVWVRSLVALVPIMLAVVLTSGPRGLVSRRPGLSLLKGLCGFLSYLAYYLAIAALPLAQVVAIVFAAPIFVTVFSALLLKETIGPRRWSAVLIGFMGVLIVVGPAGNVGNFAVLLALFAALTYASSTLLTRYIAPYDGPWTISFYSMLVFVAGSSAAALTVALLDTAHATGDPSLQFLLRPWVWPDPPDLLLMIVLGLNAAAGFYCLTRAYWLAPASVIAPFEYTFIIWAVLFGFVFWAEVPKPTTITGVSLLIASSLYVFRREYQLSQAKSHEPPRVPEQPSTAQESPFPLRQYSG